MTRSSLNQQTLKQDILPCGINGFRFARLFFFCSLLELLLLFAVLISSSVKRNGLHRFQLLSYFFKLSLLASFLRPDVCRPDNSLISQGNRLVPEWYCFKTCDGLVLLDVWSNTSAVFRMDWWQTGLLKSSQLPSCIDGHYSLVGLEFLVCQLIGLVLL